MCKIAVDDAFTGLRVIQLPVIVVKVYEIADRIIISADYQIDGLDLPVHAGVHRTGIQEKAILNIS